MMLSYEDFSRRVLKLLRIEMPTENPLNPYLSLYDELGLDSVQAFELLVVVEALAEVIDPLVDVPEIYTMQDAYDYYASLRAQQS